MPDYGFRSAEDRRREQEANEKRAELQRQDKQREQEREQERRVSNARDKFLPRINRSIEKVGRNYRSAIGKALPTYSVDWSNDTTWASVMFSYDDDLSANLELVRNAIRAEFGDDIGITVDMNYPSYSGWGGGYHTDADTHLGPIELSSEERGRD